MKLIAGLGNPGPRYAATRHNVGFHVVEAFARAHGIALDEVAFEGRFGRGRVRSNDVGLLLPETFMNRSGESVAAALAAFPQCDASTDLIVVHDDLDLPFGRIRLRPSGGAGGHRGVGDIIDALERRDFARVRVGIGRPPKGAAVIDYVLEPFEAGEQRALAPLCARVGQALEVALEQGVSAAMNRFNQATLEEAEGARGSVEGVDPVSSSSAASTSDAGGGSVALSRSRSILEKIRAILGR